MEALGGEATCLGWEGRVFPGAGVREERRVLESREKEEGGDRQERRKGRDHSFLTHPNTPCPSHT